MMCRILLYACLAALAYGCCQDGWVAFQQSCYLFADEINVDWTEGTHFCDSHNHAHIVTIESRNEELFLKDQANRLFKAGSTAGSNIWFWLGATDDEIEGVWHWYTDHRLLDSGFTDWYIGQPETGSSINQDCACLWGNNHFTWEDCACESKSHVICEVPMGSTDESQIVG